MENIAQWVGIDVSKATLDVYIRPLGKAMKVANTESEISNLVELLLSYSLNLIVRLMAVALMFVPLFIWVLLLLCVIIRLSRPFMSALSNVVNRKN